MVLLRSRPLWCSFRLAKAEAMAHSVSATTEIVARREVQDKRCDLDLQSEFRLRLVRAAWGSGA